MGGQERTPEEVEVLTVAPGAPHQMWAAEAGARVNWQTRPALKTEAFFGNVWGLAKDGKVNDKGVPSLLRGLRSRGSARTSSASLARRGPSRGCSAGRWPR